MSYFALKTIRDANYKISYAQLIKRVNQLLKKLYIYHIVPINELRYTYAQERIERLEYLKELFLTWAAEYKFEHYKKFTPDQEENKSIFSLLPKTIKKFMGSIRRHMKK